MNLWRNGKVVGLCFGILLVLIIIPRTALAVPEAINYQGYLTDAEGNPLNGDVAMTFRIYSVEISGTELWSETHAAVTVMEGVFNVVLGSSAPISQGMLDGDRYLGITVGADSEMVPRMKLTSSAYAIRAGYAESMADGSVTTSTLLDTAVTETKIASAAVSSAKLASTSVTTDKIATGAVTGTKVATGSLTATHLQDGTALAEILDDDGPDSGLNADYLDNYDSTAFSLSGHNHDATYVNVGETNSIATGMIQNAAVTKGKLSAAGGTSGQVLGTDGTNLVWQSGSPGVGWVDDGTVVRLATGTDNVGIGTTTPSSKLEMLGIEPLITLNTTGSLSGLRMQQNGSNKWQLAWNSGSAYLYFYDFSSPAGTRMVIQDGTGNVGIGTASPSSKLDVAGLNPIISLDKTSGDQAGLALQQNNTDRWRIMWSEGAQYLSFWNSGGDVGTKMVIKDTTGNVGIGTHVPAEKLVVAGNFRIQDSGNTKAYRLRTSGSALDFDFFNANMYFSGYDSLGNQSIIMLLNNERKNVGIGTTDPAENHRLQVSGAGTQYSRAGYFSNGWSGHTATVILAKTDIGIDAGGSNIGVEGHGGINDFYASGPGTNYGSASSIRWKSNIQEIDGALEKIMKLRGVYFDWDEEHGGLHDMGFIAEEVGEVIPEIVSYETDGVYASGVDYGAITPVLVQAIKEQQRQIEELKAQIAELRKRLD